MKVCGLGNGVIAAGRFARLVALMAMLSVMAIGLTACPGSVPDRLSSESTILEAESEAYLIAGNKVDKAIADGRATQAQANRFAAAQAEVRAADNLVQADLSTWRRTGVEPGTYVPNVAGLRTAQAKVAQLAREVQ